MVIKFEPPEWMKDLENARCEVFGKLVVCVSGTEKWPWTLGHLMWGGSKASSAKICFGRLDYKDYWCVRLLAESEGISTEEGVYFGDRVDYSERERKGDNVITIVDKRAGMAIALDRTNKESVEIEYGDVYLLPKGIPHKLLMRVTKALKGWEGAVRKTDWFKKMWR